MDDKKLCFTTYADGEDVAFTDYIVLYLWFLKKAYPKASAVIYTRDKYWDGWSEKWKDYFNCFTDSVLYDTCNKSLSLSFKEGTYTIKAHPVSYPNNLWTKRAVKNFPHKGDVEKYDYIYIADIDMLPIKETPSLLERRLAHCDKIKIPASYNMRIVERNGVVYPEVTGYHFYQRKETWERLGKVWEKFNNILEKGTFFSEYPEAEKSGIWDEYFLYNMYKEGNMLTDKEDPESPWNKNGGNIGWHGIHPGPFRREFKNRNWKKGDWVKGLDYWKKWKEVEEDQEYKKLLNNCCGEVKFSMSWMRDEYVRMHGE